MDGRGIGHKLATGRLGPIGFLANPGWPIQIAQASTMPTGVEAVHDKCTRSISDTLPGGPSSRIPASRAASREGTGRECSPRWSRAWARGGQPCYTARMGRHEGTGERGHLK